jgi:nitrous oxidase accessory protein NosD
MPVNPAEPTGIVCGIEFGAQSYHGLAEGNKIENGSMGISFARGHYGKAIGNTLIGQTFFAIEMADSPGCVIQGNVINGSGRLGSLPSGSAITTHGGAGLSNDISIIGNHIYGIHDSGRSISLSHSRYTVTGNTVESKYGMTLSNVSDANVSNNVIRGKGPGQGVQLVKCNRIVMSGNTVQSQNVGVQISASASTAGIFNISNNRFWDCIVPVDEVAVSGSAIAQNVIKQGNIVGPP